jgi:hypothetical protein
MYLGCTLYNLGISERRKTAPAQIINENDHIKIVRLRGWTWLRKGNIIYGLNSDPIFREARVHFFFV